MRSWYFRAANQDQASHGAMAGVPVVSFSTVAHGRAAFSLSFVIRGVQNNAQISHLLQ